MLRKANKREDVALYERLQSVLAKAIAPTAAERFSSMAEFVSRLKGRDDAPVKGNEESHDIESVAGPYQSKQLASSIGKWASRGKLAVAATALLALCAWLSFRGCGDGKPGKPTPPGVDIRMSSVTNEYTATCDGAQLQVAPPALEQEKVVVPPPQEYAAPQECIPPQPVQQPPAPVQVAENPRSAGAERQSQTRTDRPASQQRRRSRSDNDTTPSTRRRRAHDEQQPPASQPVMVYLPSSPNGSDRVGIPCYNHDWPAEGVLFEDAQNILLIRRNCELTVLAIKQPQQERPETGAAMQGEPHSSDAGNQDAAQETETHPTESDAGSQAAAQRTEATPNPGCSDTH
jgi:hypothetical protein